MTDAEFTAWLIAPSSIRISLIEVEVMVGGIETTRYIGTAGYVTGGADTPPNTVYLPIVAGGIRYTERISLSAEASLNGGDIELNNHDGAYDEWLNDIWRNRRIRVWIGDPRWGRGDFRLIFDGTVDDIDSRSRDTLNIKLLDKLQLLNTPVSEETLGGSTPNAEQIIPISLGENHNVAPLLTNPVTYEFQIHGGQVERIIEVRDNGKPVATTVTLATGKFILANSPAGAITVSVQGDAPAGAYSNTIGALVQRLVTGFGKESTRFDADDLDAVNLAAFEAAHPQPVGIYIAERTNVLVACQMLASSVGAQIVMSRAGKLRLIQIAMPPVGTPTEITDDHMVERSLRAVERTEVVAAVKLGFCRNYLKQPGLLTTIPAQHKDLFAEEWLIESADDPGVQESHRLDTQPPQEPTCLLVRADALAEAERRRDLRVVQHTVYEFEGTPEMLLLELGQAVNITTSRFGMAGGALGLVVSLAPNWVTGNVTVGVLV